MRLVLVSYQKELDCDPSFIGAYVFRLYTCGYCNQTHVQDLYTMYIHIIYILCLSEEHNKFIIMLYNNPCTDASI